MTRYGDLGLADSASTLLRDRPGAWAVCEVTPAGVRLASARAELDADYEIGSVSKALTGLLYADAVRRADVNPETTLAEHLDLAGSAVGGVTLASLSTHASGLPRLPPGMRPVRRTWALWRHGVNPYHEDRAALVSLARHTRLRRRHRPSYSNLGFALLGHAVAAAAGTPYDRLVHDRLVEPLGLDATYVPASVGELRPGAASGTNRRGRPTEPWTGTGISPAGFVRSSAPDLALLLRALLDRTAPGTDALEPVRSFQGRRLRIGAGWLVLTIKGREVTWHNGGTGGFRSWVGLDRAAGTGVAVLSATTRSVDGAGFRLLQDAVSRQA